MRKTLFQLGPGLHLQWLLYSLLSLSIAIGDQRFSALQSLRAGLEVLLYPIQYVVSAPSSILHLITEHSASRITLIDRNRTLEREILFHHALLQKHEALEVENRRLQHLLNSSQYARQTVQVAELMLVNLAAFKQEIIINQGARNDVFVGQAIIDAHGIMGQVIRINPFSARVLLITDPNHAISAQSIRTGIRAVVIGGGRSDWLEMRHIPNTADIRIGDLFVSSGLDGRFPSNYPVARITEITHPQGAHFAKVNAQPIARINHSREVLLMRRSTDSSPPVDIKPDG